MRYKFRHSRYQPPPLLFQPQHYSVAWHLRLGDIVLHQGEPAWFENVANEVWATPAPRRALRLRPLRLV